MAAHWWLAEFVCVMFVSSAAISSEPSHWTVRFHSAGSPAKLRELVVSPDGATVALTTNDNDLSLVRLTEGELLHRLTNAMYGGLAFSDDGHRLLATTETRILVLDGSTLKILQENWRREEKEASVGVKFADANGKVVVASVTPNMSASLAGKPSVGAILLAVAGGEEPEKGATDEQNDWDSTARMSAASCQSLLSGRPGTWVRLKFQVQGEKEPQTVALRRATLISRGGSSVAQSYLSPGAESVSVQAEHDDIVVRSVSRGQSLGGIRPVDLRANAIWMTKHGKLIAIGGKLRGRTAQGVEIYDLQTGKKTTYSDSPLKDTGYGSFHPDGNQLLMGGRDSIEVFSLADSRWIRSIPLFKKAKSLKEAPGLQPPREDEIAWVPPFNGLRVSVSKDGLMAVGSSDGYVRLVGYADGELQSELPRIENKSPIEWLSFTPDGSTLIYFIHGTLHIVGRPFVGQE